MHKKRKHNLFYLQIITTQLDAQLLGNEREGKFVQCINILLLNILTILC